MVHSDISFVYPNLHLQMIRVLIGALTSRKLTGKNANDSAARGATKNSNVFLVVNMCELSIRTKESHNKRQL